MSPADPRPKQPLSARKRGRRIAGAIYYGLIGAVCVAATVQVTLQLHAQPAVASPYASCHDGLRALVDAVERARGAAPGADGEDRALERFRMTLEPAWRHFDGVAATCKGSEKDEGALDAIERLRYAEEHAVRREAAELAPLRQRVQAIIDTDLAPTPARAP